MASAINRLLAGDAFFLVPRAWWIGIFEQASHHPDTGQVVGAVMLVPRMTPGKGAQAQMKIVDAKSDRGSEAQVAQNAAYPRRTLSAAESEVVDVPVQSNSLFPYWSFRRISSGRLP
jgi:hypothetical protein